MIHATTNPPQHLRQQRLLRHFRNTGRQALLPEQGRIAGRNDNRHARQGAPRRLQLLDEIASRCIRQRPIKHQQIVAGRLFVLRHQPPHSLGCPPGHIDRLAAQRPEQGRHAFARQGVIIDDQSAQPGQ